jgi:cytidine deaminase
MEHIKILDASDSAVVANACQTYGISTKEFTELRSLSSAAKGKAYCPYSQFRVGATVLVDTRENESAEGPGPSASGGTVSEYVSGANVENASYPVGTCAERVAFGTAVVAGMRKFRAVAVATDVSPPSSPCGMCRQL